jgi:hypothetical protein
MLHKDITPGLCLCLDFAIYLNISINKSPNYDEKIVLLWFKIYGDGHCELYEERYYNLDSELRDDGHIIGHTNTV